MPPSPPPSSGPTITRLIEAQYAIELELRQHLSTPGLVSPGLSLAVAIQDANPAGLDSFQTSLRSYLLSDDSSFKRRNVRQLLDDLLARDAHLKACCQSSWGLARAVEILGPLAIKSSPLSWDEGGQEFAIARILEALYETDYRREVYIHLYNFQLEQSPLPIPIFGAQIVGLSETDLPRLIGEITLTSALHDTKTGTCFASFIDQGDGDDNEVFQKCWLLTESIAKILKYFKSGVVDVDYGGIYYRPVWVNEIRRNGIRIWGLPRKDGQKEAYSLGNQELQKFDSYCKAFRKVEPLINEVSTSLRQATALAGNYFEDHHKRLKAEEKLIDLIIALEILFSPSREGELRFRIAQRGAVLLGGNAHERLAVRDFILSAYDARSALVHAGESPFLEKSKKRMTDGDLARLADYVRQAILRLFVLHWKGEARKEVVHALLDKCALDQSALDKLHEDVDLDAAIPRIVGS